MESSLLAYEDFLASSIGTSALPSSETSISNSLGTQTAVGYYFTTTPLDPVGTIVWTKFYSPTITITASNAGMASPTSGVTPQSESTPPNNRLSKNATIAVGIGAGIGGAPLMSVVMALLRYQRRKRKPHSAVDEKSASEPTHPELRTGRPAYELDMNGVRDEFGVEGHVSEQPPQRRSSELP
ncbi:MAG: hypothetical protein LQ340_001052 [Diploschistes diacapsis]|nr:MAG: hypothetical protein LQ340_001052 [Diploschistes diacapsis]